MAQNFLLIVDDEQQLRSILVEQLSPLGVTIASAENGEAALAILEKTPADAVLCDINMPKMDGLELLQRVREMGLETPFIFLTGYAGVEPMREALKLGAIDFLEKPWATGELIRTVMRALDLSRQSKRLEAKIANSISPEKADEIQEDKKRLASVRGRR